MSYNSIHDLNLQAEYNKSSHLQSSDFTQYKHFDGGTDNNFITRYLSSKWTLLTHNKYIVLFYSVIFSGLFVGSMCLGAPVMISSIIALMITGSMAFILGQWIFDNNDADIGEVSTFVYTIAVVLLFLLLGLSMYFNIDLSMDTPLIKGF